MNLWDLLLAGLILLAIICALRKLCRDRKEGKGCSGNCADCGKSCRR